MTEPDIVFDKEHTVRKIWLKPEQVWTTMLGHDAIVQVEIGGHRFEAMVPTTSLRPAPSRGDGHKFVPAEQIGRIGDKLIIVLPPEQRWHTDLACARRRLGRRLRPTIYRNRCT